MAKNWVALEAWAPLRESKLYLFKEPVIPKMTEKDGKDAGQIIIRFEHKEGGTVFPKSVHEARIKSNMEIFDFELNSAEMAQMRALDKGKGMHDPDAPGVEEMLSQYDVHAND